MNCPICRSKHVIKNGFTRTGRQRFVCVPKRHSFLGEADRLRIKEKRLRREIRMKVKDWQFEHWLEIAPHVSRGARPSNTCGLRESK